MAPRITGECDWEEEEKKKKKKKKKKRIFLMFLVVASASLYYYMERWCATLAVQPARGALDIFIFSFL